MGRFLKMYMIGSVLSLLAAFIGLVDSFGGLMYVQGPDVDDSWTKMHSPNIRSRFSRPSKGIGS